MSEPPTTFSGPGNQPPRREVRYNSLSAILEDAIFLANHPHQATGNWSYGKILQHLADSMNYSFDGTPFRVNPFVRLIVQTFYKKKLIQGPMWPGVKLPQRAEVLLPDNSIPVATGLASLKAAIARFETTDPTAPNPFLGKLTREEWIKLHLNHAALHMSFVNPA